MMIVDADTHISNLRTENRITAEELISKMDESKVDKALAWLQPVCDIAEGNRYIYESMKKYPGRILGVGWVDPKAEGVDKSRDMIKRCVEEYGFFGVKMNGAQNFYDILNREFAEPIIEEIAKTGKVLAFHSDGDNNTHPSKIAVIAQRYPETTILLVHMGMTATDAAIEAAAANKNIVLIGSGMPDYSAVLTAVEKVGTGRVCYGSDTPFQDMKGVISQYMDILKDKIPQADLENVMANNLLRVFDLL